MTSAKLCRGRCVGGGDGVRGEGGSEGGGGSLGHNAITMHQTRHMTQSNYIILIMMRNILPVSCQKTFKYLHTLTNIPYHWKLKKKKKR